MLSDAAITFLLFCILFPALLLIPAMGLLWHSACALANREETFLKAMLLGSLTFFPCAVVGTFIVDYVGRFETSQEVRFGGYHLLGIFLALMFAWVVGTVVYTIPFQGKVLKALQVSLYETLMRVLLAFLVGGIYLVVMATIQVGKDPQGLAVLIVFGLGFVAFLAVIAAIFFIVWLIRQQSLR